MTVPDFQTIMLPLLRFAEDDKEHSLRDAVAELASHFSLSEDELNRLQPSGQGPVFYKRVGWSRTYLKKAGLVEDPRRGFFRITDRGKEVLAENPSRLDMKYLERFPEYVEFRDTSKERDVDAPDQAVESDLTPEEALEISYQSIRVELVDEILSQIAGSTPGFFERLVIDLLVEMGYGGSRREAARAVGLSGDEGIDGIIDEDRLGLDTVYVQAKRWKPSTPVGRPEIQKFVGALQGQRARKGIFITTSRFTDDAEKYVLNIDPKVVLIDGRRLADLMIDHGVGVSLESTYRVKRIDSEYFGSS